MFPKLSLELLYLEELTQMDPNPYLLLQSLIMLDSILDWHIRKGTPIYRTTDLDTIRVLSIEDLTLVYVHHHIRAVPIITIPKVNLVSKGIPDSMHQNLWIDYVISQSWHFPPCASIQFFLITQWNDRGACERMVNFVEIISKGWAPSHLW